MLSTRVTFGKNKVFLRIVTLRLDIITGFKTGSNLKTCVWKSGSNLKIGQNTLTPDRIRGRIDAKLKHKRKRETETNRSEKGLNNMATRSIEQRISRLENLIEKLVESKTEKVVSIKKVVEHKGIQGFDARVDGNNLVLTIPMGGRGVKSSTGKTEVLQDIGVQTSSGKVVPLYFKTDSDGTLIPCSFKEADYMVSGRLSKVVKDHGVK